MNDRAEDLSLGRFMRLRGVFIFQMCKDVVVELSAKSVNLDIV